MKETVEKIQKMGYYFLYEPYEADLKDESGRIQHLCIAFIKDPDGNEIEIIQKR